MSTKERNPSPTTRVRSSSGARRQVSEETQKARASKPGVEQSKTVLKANQTHPEKNAEGTPRSFVPDRRSSQNKARTASPPTAEQSPSRRNVRSARGMAQPSPVNKPAHSPRIDEEIISAYKAMRVPSDDQGQFDLISKMQLEIKRLARELDESRAQKVAAEAGKNELINENNNMKQELATVLSNQKYKNHTIKKLERELLEARARLETERNTFVIRLAEMNRNTSPGSHASSSPPRRVSPRPQRQSSPGSGNGSGDICDKCKDKIRSGQYPAGAVPLRDEDGLLKPQDYKMPDLYLNGETPIEQGASSPKKLVGQEPNSPAWKKELQHLKQENEALRGELEALSAIQNDGRSHLEVIQKMNDDLDRVLEERSVLEREVAHWKAQAEAATDVAPEQGAAASISQKLAECQEQNKQYEQEIASLSERLRLSDEQLKPYLETKSREKALIETVAELRSQLQDMTKRLLAYEQNKSPKSSSAPKPKSKEGGRSGSKPAAKK